MKWRMVGKQHAEPFAPIHQRQPYSKPDTKERLHGSLQLQSNEDYGVGCHSTEEVRSKAFPTVAVNGSTLPHVTKADIKLLYEDDLSIFVSSTRIGYLETKANEATGQVESWQTRT